MTTNDTKTTKPEASKTRESETTMTFAQVKESFNHARRSLRQIRQQQQEIMGLLQENTIVDNAVTAIADGSEYEAIIPLGAGISVKGKIRGKELLRSLPGNVIVATTKKEIEEDLAERKKIFQKELDVLHKQAMQASEYARNMDTLMKAFRQANKKAATKR